MAEFAVELSDLRGFAKQVGRASDDMAAAKDYAAANIADADFGRILELITGDYAALIPQFHAVVQEDSNRLGSSGRGLDGAATNYREADDKSAGELAKLPGGQTGSVTDDGVANGFDDRGSAVAALVTLGGGGVPPLPEVSFGFMLDKVCDLIQWIGGPDPREHVTRWIAGDLNKAARHVEAWKAVAECCDIVEDNLKSGGKSIANTWTGDAAVAAIAHIEKWASCLLEQAGAMRKMGEHLWDMIGQAVKMAQVVVDIIRTVVSVVMAGLANASIPFYGQWKLISSIKEAITMVWSAIKVVRVFLNMLILVIDTIKMCIGAFSVAKLPPAPAGNPA